MGKLYCYVDESGQDTKGTFFIVAIVVVSGSERREQLERELSDLECQLGKRTDWRHSKTSIKQTYLKRILTLPLLRGNILYGLYRGRQDYDQMMGEALVKAILKRRKEKRTKVIVEIEGQVNGAKRKRITTAFKRAGIRYERVRGRRFESSALIRLADAIAGFLSDRERGKAYVTPLLKELGGRDPFPKL